MHVKVPDSILWVGPAVGRPRSLAGNSRLVMCTAKAAIRGRGGGDQAQLYKYNGNLLHLSTFSLLEVVAGGMNFCGRKVFVCMQKLENLPAEIRCVN